MQQIFHKISPGGYHEQVESHISFVPFYQFLIGREERDHTVKKEWYRMLANKIRQYPELTAAVKEDELSKYCNILELIYAAMTGFSEEEDELWGMSIPGSMDIFYGTNALFNLLPDTAVIMNIYDCGGSFKNTNKKFVDFLYAEILHRFYGYRTIIDREIVHSFIHPATGLMKYYRLDIDTAFTEIAAKEKLPELNFLQLEDHVLNNTIIQYLSVIIPLNKFTFSGFNICRLEDVTDKYAVESIRNTILMTSADSPDSCIAEVTMALKTLAGHQEIDIGLIPFILLNNKLLLDFGEIGNSILLKQGRKDGLSDEVLLGLYHAYIKKPYSRYYKRMPEVVDSSNIIVGVLRNAGLKSFALLPVYYHNELLGVLEIYSRKEGLLTEKGLSRMDAALPHIGQLMKTEKDEFAARINNTVNENYTSIQPAVRWKFNQAAWHYLQSQFNMRPKEDVEIIAFRHVHPFYGSVDIRNSSIEANNALAKDLLFHLEFLLDSVSALQVRHPENQQLEQVAVYCKGSLSLLNGSITREDEHRLHLFFTGEVMPVMNGMLNADEYSAGIATEYLESLSESIGKAHTHRRNLERSMMYITQGVNNYLDLMKSELQLVYPCYFEKFRTDGVEYDIYIGQEIAPEIPFQPEHLKKVKMLQLASMAAVSKLTDSLLSQMPTRLMTTQLIFINADPIDISFRNDEKRFDVDGGYNIRYQVIKKRIDKVHIRNSAERLTQPGKIAIVYFNEDDANEYRLYIMMLQQQNVLHNDLEYLDLEDLQGVIGLRALRVGVNFS